MRNKIGTLVIAALIAFTGCSSKELNAGEAPAPKVVHAYLVAPLITADEVSSKLLAAGFEVIGSYTVGKKLETVVFTNTTLRSMANKPNRGFAGIGRILIDGNKNQISISNPVYFGKAFMQDTADYTQMLSVKNALTSVFVGTKETGDKWGYSGLADYHFMVAMPYYQDSIVIGEGNVDFLLEKAEAYKEGKMHLFTLKLAKGKYLVGYGLSKRTANFPKKIGTDKAGLLPYTILIENEEARILAPKYYLAVSYPQLTMSQFMRIARIPGAIEKDLTKPFN
ncbi:hypothetical protein JHD50_03510 [Sulfurimonas sp. MAG313]|nr:hypothetical protein [Sulfurimonas sp. MAG313]MDF1880379.1 hypothetical protein [Sulfurimonas sp. MAG313]